MSLSMAQLPSQVGQSSQLTAHSSLGTQSSAASATSHWPSQPPESIILALEKWQTTTTLAYKNQVKLVATKKAQFTKLAAHKASGSFTADLGLKFTPHVNIPKTVPKARADAHRQSEASKFLDFKNSVLDGRIVLAEEDWQDSKVVLANLLSDRWLKEQLLQTSPSMSQFMYAFSNYLVGYKVAVEAYNAEMAERAAEAAASSRAAAADVTMSEDTPDTSNAALRADIKKLTAQVQALTMKFSATASPQAKPKNGSGPGRGTTNPPRSKQGQTRADNAKSASRPQPRSSTSRPKRQSSPNEDPAPTKSQKRNSSPPPRQVDADHDAGRGRSPHRKNNKRAPSSQKRSASRS